MMIHWSRKPDCTYVDSFTRMDLTQMLPIHRAFRTWLRMQRQAPTVWGVKRVDTGCSILFDGWTDANDRTFVNILVDCVSLLVWHNWLLCRLQTFFVLEVGTPECRADNHILELSLHEGGRWISSMRHWRWQRSHKICSQQSGSYIFASHYSLEKISKKWFTRTCTIMAPVRIKSLKGWSSLRKWSKKLHTLVHAINTKPKTNPRHQSL